MQPNLNTIQVNQEPKMHENTIWPNYIFGHI